jgi:hypothetical protein
MRTQPTPNITKADVDRLVERDYPPDQRGEVVAMLHEYGAEDWHPEVDRVRVAALKLAAGNRAHLRLHIDAARVDYRDVLAAAEYPGYMKRVPASEAVSSDTRERIIQDDWDQYHTWLTR